MALLMGVATTALAAAGEARAAGVRFGGLNGTVGGTASEARNLISGNTAEGISISGSGAKVQSNLIGTEKDGASPLGNGFSGMALF